MEITRIKDLGNPTTDDAGKIFDTFIAENAMVAGDVVQYSDTDSTAFPIGIAVEDASADSLRVAGVVTNTAAIGEHVRVQVYGYNENITTDGNVTTSDVFFSAGTAVAEGITIAELDTAYTDASVQGELIPSIFAWNVKADVSTVGEAFITCM